jgi:phage tail-like protein
MNGERLKTYGLATPAQWRAGLTERLRIGDDGLSVMGRLGDDPVIRDEGAALTPAADRRGNLFWRRADGHLVRRGHDQDQPCVLEVPAGMAQASRLVAWRKWLWALDPSQRRITRYFANTIQEAATIPLGAVYGAAAVSPGECDIAPDGHDGVWVLLAAQRRAYWLHAGADGRRHGGVAVPSGATQLTTLDRGRVLVLLDPEKRILSLLSVEHATLRATVKLADVLPGFQPITIAGNATDRILLAGDADRLPGDRKPGAGGPWRLVLVLDNTGGLVDFLNLGAPPKLPAQQTIGLAGLRDTVWVADAAGIGRFETGRASGKRAIFGQYLTPVLLSPEGRERGWLRAELTGDLAPGAFMRVRYASTSDAELQSWIVKLASDTSVPPGIRRQRIDACLRDLWSEPLRFDGEPAAPQPCAGETPAPPPARIVPLHEAQGKWLWLSVEMQTGTPDRLPLLRTLRVRYPELSLMQNLPAIYRGEGDRDGFLRRIVAVLEATTQDIDERIERLGTLVDPSTAPADWLDFLASWLGLPWHEQLPDGAKRALLRAAASIRQTRGTRAGILALLRCVLPGRPVRILDPGVDFAPAMVGSRSARANNLPALLLGRPKSLAALGSPHAVLGQIRLKCPDDASTPLDALDGYLLVEITANGEQRKQFDAILRHLLRDFVPLGIAFELRWRSHRSGIDARLDDFVLEGRREAALDGESLLGRAILPRDGVGTLRADGLTPGFKLH